MDQVTIYNMAVARIGVTMPIQDISEKTNAAIQCTIFFESVRDRVLAAFPWNFAKRTLALSDIGNPPYPWQHRYGYPNDCIKARAVVPDVTATTNIFLAREIAHYGESQKIPFDVVEDEANNGKAIVTSLTKAMLIYTARISNLDVWSADAASACAWLLAAEVGGALSGKPEYAKMAGDAYTMAIREAGANSQNEGYSPDRYETDLLTVRY